ncbi:MAG: hypothetical protein WA997_00510 [Anaerolineales bacterium]
MRRVYLIVAVILISCQAASSFKPRPTAITTPTPTAAPTIILPTAASLPTVTPTALPETEFNVILHPDGSLFVGDQISIEVISLADINLKEIKVQVQVDGIKNDQSSAGFSEQGIGGRLQATFNWIWDTGDLQPGEYLINFSIQPEGPSWTETVRLLPADDVPNPEPAAHWVTETLECCEIYFISGTDFAQDLPSLMDIIQAQAEQAVLSMGVGFDQRIPVTILPRVLGHGGFAADEIYVSYIESNYAGNDLAQVLHHEMIHILDRRLGGDLRPSLLVEGLAVYLSQGHFKKEPIIPRASALVDLGWYLPLTELSDSFYTSQHEIGYLEGAALVEFMINRYGWLAFSDFYRDIHPHPSERESKALDAAIQAHFDISFQQLESLFTAELNRQHIIPDMRADLILSVNYYEAVRRYQLILDPSAYFLTAWLPEGEQMRQNGIVADYLRRPSTPQNLSIEELLIEVDLQIRAGNYFQAGKALYLVNQKLDLIQNDVLTGTYQPKQDQHSFIRAE